MPAAIQTERTPGTVGTWRLISEGCTKMEAPMMMPTTMAVAWSNPMGRSGAVAKMGPSVSRLSRSEFAVGVLVQFPRAPCPDGFLRGCAVRQDRRPGRCGGLAPGGPAILRRGSRGGDPALRVHRPQDGAARVGPPSGVLRPGLLPGFHLPGAGRV